MRTFENLLIKFADLLCKLLSVTPGQLEYIRRKKKGPAPMKDRPNVMEM